MAVMCTSASPPRMQIASPGQRESFDTPLKRTLIETSSMTADSPRPSSNSRLSGIVGPVGDSSQPSAPRARTTRRYRITIENTLVGRKPRQFPVVSCKFKRDSRRAEPTCFLRLPRELCGFCANHYAGRMCRRADDGRHHGGVGHPQTLEPSHTEPRIDDGAGAGAHAAGAGGVIDAVHGPPDERDEIGLTDSRGTG